MGRGRGEIPARLDSLCNLEIRYVPSSPGFECRYAQFHIHPVYFQLHARLHAPSMYPVVLRFCFHKLTWKSSLEFYSLDHWDQTGKIMLEFFLQSQASSYTALSSLYISTITGSRIENGNYTSTCRFVPRRRFLCVQIEAKSVINCALVCKDLGSFTVWSPLSRHFGCMVYS